MLLRTMEIFAARDLDDGSGRVLAGVPRSRSALGCRRSSADWRPAPTGCPAATPGVVPAAPGHQWTTVTLIGRIQTEHLSELCAQLDAIGESIVLDLGDVSVVNLDVVQFLSTCESEGIQLLNCPTYIRKWIDREKVTGPKS